MLMNFDLFSIFFLFIIGVFVFHGARGIAQWNKNNNSPRLTVDAMVVAKRTSVTHHNHPNADGHGHHTTTSTSYYATFQVESGDRMELSVHSREYGFLVEGDQGKLSFQGTRYLGFQRSY